MVTFFNLGLAFIVTNILNFDAIFVLFLSLITIIRRRIRIKEAQIPLFAEKKVDFSEKSVF